jgi:hypothetical protein
MRSLALLFALSIIPACHSKGDEASGVPAATSGPEDLAPSPSKAPRVIARQPFVVGDHCCSCNNGCQKSRGGLDLEAACLAWCTSKGDPSHTLSEGRCKVERCP